MTNTQTSAIKVAITTPDRSAFQIYNNHRFSWKNSVTMVIEKWFWWLYLFFVCPSWNLSGTCEDLCHHTCCDWAQTHLRHVSLCQKHLTVTIITSGATVDPCLSGKAAFVPGCWREPAASAHWGPGRSDSEAGSSPWGWTAGADVAAAAWGTLRGCSGLRRHSARQLPGSGEGENPEDEPGK